MIRRPPRSTLSSSSAASDVYKRQTQSTWEKLKLKKILFLQKLMETEPQKALKTDFPSIVSSVHNQAVIMTRIDPEQKERFFVSVQDVIDGTAGDRSTLQTYEEFCNYLAQPNIVPLSSAEDKNKCQQLLQSKKSNLFTFKKKIDEEKSGVKKLLSEKLQELYKNKCAELVEKLQKELDGQNKLFNDNYDKLGHELTIDREREAGLTKYEEIKKKVKELHTPSEIESYLQEVYKSKKTWKTASQSIQTLGPRTEEFYEQLIEKQFSNAPKLANVDKLIETWVSGLDKLITEVKADANVFKNLVCDCHLFVPLEAQNLKEFTLVTNEMLKQDTQLQITLSGKALTESEITLFTEHLSKLTNLVHLIFDIDGTAFSIASLEELIKPFENLKQLSTLQVKAYGTKLGDAGVQSLAKLFSLVPNITGLSLELGANKITSTGLAYLSEEISKLAKLKCLSLSMEGNPIKSQGFNTFEENLVKIIPMLCGLKLNFGDCTEKSKATTESSISRSIVKMLSKATMLKMLSLELGNNQNENDILKDLISIFPNMVSLQDLTLDLNNNKLDLKGANRLAKLFTSNKLSSLNLNLAGNQIKTEGAKCIIDALKTMNILQNLKLNLRNTGIKKGFATQMKADLEEKPEKFEKFEFLA
eukprot:TRINITY_DN47358_c0_g1_i2.p1 TRINITY_DN47358_c0_g1~~TRINITY_DN47358_c0_g1_i2.p1  ORF type:complete len:645 (-),score=92.33 TRINITY_DN47358_c0_g1_i2:73-2007(-)